MFVRRGLPLRWRIAVLATLAIAVLSGIASLATFWVARASLFGDLRSRLRADVKSIALAYSGKEANLVERISTGGVVIQLYDKLGQLYVASNPVFEDATKAALPAEVIQQVLLLEVDSGVRDWQGILAERSVQAAIARYDLGVAVSLAQTDFIGEALRKLAKSLLITALLLILASALVGYIVALVSMRPLSQLARLAATLGPERLEPIGYAGPKDEVGQLATVLNDLVARLKAALDAQRSFLAETSHELRTPLTSLQGFLERASRRANLSVQNDLDDAKRIAQTMSRLVADILQLSRGELVREMVPHLLDPFTDILAPVAEEFPGVHLTGQAGETLLGDPERLRQLIRNLAANAVRATGNPAEVELRLVHCGSKLCLEVADAGPGIPKEMLPHIFDKFYKGPGGGAGLGLTIAKQIAEAHGAKLEVKSKLGQGSTFRLIMPELEAVGEDTLF